MDLLSSEGSTFEEGLTIADLYNEYQVRLQRYALSLTLDADRADDLAQETLIQAMLHLETLERLNSHQRRAWLYRVLKNRFIDQQRSRRRASALLEQLAEQAWSEDDPAARVAASGLFESLPEKYRGLLEKRYLLGMTSEQIGQELGIPAATVRSRIRLALNWLRAHASDFI